MTLIVIGPATEDLIIRNGEKDSRTGGASYFQSFFFEKFYPDYISIVNCGNNDLIYDFPDSGKVRVIEKDDTHYFINEYPYPDNPDIRVQSSNFADIPIEIGDLEGILSEIDEIDAFILNPLNAFDFPLDTIDFLKSFDIPVYISLQGFLRHPLKKTAEDTYSIGLKYCENVKSSISGIDGLFMDEREASILFENLDLAKLNIDEIIITNGSEGSRVISDRQYKINAVECGDMVDSTGCGDTYMAAYISKKLDGESAVDSANFASMIASEKLKFKGPFR